MVAPIVTNAPQDTYPTHYDSLGHGGYMTMQTISSRDAIPAQRRKQGMLVYVRATDSLYQLNTDLTTWTAFKLGVGETIDTTSLSNRINTKLNISDTTNKWQPKGSYITTETDPTVPSYVKSITTTEINLWNSALQSGDNISLLNNDAGYINEIVAGSGISVAGNIVTNTAPDQTVSITGSNGITITGTYPNFNIAGTSGTSSDSGKVFIDYGLTNKNDSTIMVDSTIIAAKSWVLNQGFLKTYTETDPIANAKTITNNAGLGITITGNSGQMLGTNPTWTYKVDTSKIAAKSYVDTAIAHIVIPVTGVTKVEATGQNGIDVTGSPITDSGTFVISADTVNDLASKLYVDNNVAVLTNKINTKLNISDTTNKWQPKGNYLTQVVAGSGITVSGANNNVVTNTAPDQIVSLTGVSGITISGTYPNFTISGSGTASGLRKVFASYGLLNVNDSTLKLDSSIIAAKSWVLNQGFLTSFTETDPIWNTDKVNYLLNSSQSLNWDSAFNTTRAKFVTSSLNSPVSSTTFSGIFLPYASSNLYGAELALRDNSFYFRTRENGTNGSWIQLADRTWVNNQGFLTSFTESDPIANAKTITNTQGYGISITGTANQTLTTNPSWLYKVDTSVIASKTWVTNNFSNGGSNDSGTVTKIAVTGANGINVSGSPITDSGTIALSIDTISTIAGKQYTLNTFQKKGNYLTPADTASLSNRINTKLNISDTTNKWQPKGNYLTQEQDTIALHKTITENQGSGILITGTAAQLLSSNPAWTFKADTSLLVTHTALNDTLNGKLILDTTTNGLLYAILGDKGIHVTNGTNTVINNDVSITADTTFLATQHFVITHQIDTTSLSNRINQKQDILTAGTNIDITGNVISATNIDTTSLSNRINTKLNISDTTGHWQPLGNYLTTELDPIWISDSSSYYKKTNVFNKSESDARYLQSFTETDPIALNKTITNNEGYGLTITGTSSQTLTSNPSWTFKIDTSKISTISYVDSAVASIDTSIFAKKIGTYPSLTSGNSQELGGQLPSYYLDYHNLTDTPTIPLQFAPIEGTGITITGTYPNMTFTNSAPDKTVTITGSNGITITGTYPNFNIVGNSGSGSSSGQIFIDYGLTNKNDSTIMVDSTIIAAKSWVLNQGFLTSFNEIDPVWVLDSSSYYKKTDVFNKNQSDARYLQSYTETDPIALNKTITNTQNYGIIITGTASQTLSSSPSWGYKTDTSVIASKTWVTDNFSNAQTIDTTSLSNRINTKLNISDTTNKWQPKGNYLTTETDPIANAKTITANQGTGILITGTPGQTLTTNPSWTFKADTSILATLTALNDTLKDKLILDTSSTSGHLYSIEGGTGISVENGTNTVINHNVIINPDTSILATKHYVDSSIVNIDTTSLLNRIDAKQDILTAGTNISIVGNVISATGAGAGSGIGQVIAGNGLLNVNDSTLKVDTSEIATLFSLKDSLNNYYNKTQSDNRYLQSFTELDPIANAKTISLNQGSGILITGTASQTLTTNPTWSLKVDTSLLSTHHYVDSSIANINVIDTTSLSNRIDAKQNTLIAGDNITINNDTISATQPDISFDTLSNYYTKTQSDSRFLQSFTELDPIWLSDSSSYYKKTDVFNKTQSDNRYLQSYNETDPVATIINITNNQGSGILITGASAQTLGSSPVWTYKADTSLLATQHYVLTHQTNIDTTSLSNRINTKLNISDTSVFAKKTGTYPSLTSGNSQELGGQLPSYYLDYHNMTDTPTIPQQFTPVEGSGISITGSYPNMTFTNTAPDQTVTITGSNGITITGTYPNFNIVGSSGTGSDSGKIFVDYGLTNKNDSTIMVDSTIIASKLWVNNQGFLKSFTESDPIAIAKTIKINTANGLTGSGQHALGDNPEFSLSIDTSTTIASKSWVNNQGFLTSFNEIDPIWIADSSLYYKKANVFNKSESDARYLQSYTETDPTVSSFTKGLTTNTAVLNSVKAVDGSGSGLDADLLDGHDGTYYLDYDNFTNTPTIPQKVNLIAGNGVTITGTYPNLTISASTIDTTNADSIGIVFSANGVSGDISYSLGGTDSTVDLLINDSIVSSHQLHFATKDWVENAIHDSISALGGGSVTSVSITGTGGLSVSGSPITSSGTIALTIDTATTIASKSWVNNQGFIKSFTESDPIAIAKTITLTQGSGILVTGTAGQTVGNNPSWTLKADTSKLATITYVNSKFQSDTTSSVLSIKTITSNYTTLSSDHTILCNASSGNIAVSVSSTATTKGQVLVIKKISTGNNTVTITPTSGTIDGEASKTLVIPYSSITIQYDGSNYYIL